MKRILLATDFSDSAQNAQNYILKVVENTDVKLDLVNVYEFPALSASTLPSNAVTTWLASKKEYVLDKLNEQKDLIPERNQGDIHAVYGVYPSSDIVDISNNINADLIVMALRQKYSLFDRLMGTTTAHTIEKSSTPVLAIPSDAKFSEINEVLFPTSISSVKNLSEVEEEALLALSDFVSLVGFPDVEMVYVTKEDGVDVEFQDRPIEGIKFIVTHAKSVEEGILKCLEKKKINLLAFYKPNRTFWQRLYHSSMTRKLLFQRKLPLLVFS